MQKIPLLVGAVSVSITKRNWMLPKCMGDEQIFMLRCSVSGAGAQDGPIMAGATMFQVTIYGRGGHGAMPHLTTDPVRAFPDRGYELFFNFHPKNYPNNCRCPLFWTQVLHKNMENLEFWTGNKGFWGVLCSFCLLISSVCVL